MAAQSYAYAAGCQAKAKLPSITGDVVNVSNVDELHQAISSLEENTTVLLAPGLYKLKSTLYIRTKNITLRGDGNNCETTILEGKGMENPNHDNTPHGIWSDAVNLTITNLSIRGVYQHGIILNPGAQSPKIQSVQILDTGTQFIKANPTSYAVGVDNGIVEDSVFAYTAAPPNTNHGGGVGYTNGVDVHAGDNWVIRNNHFENFHTPDSSQWWWNPAILMWNGATNTTVENNVFIDVDRAISFGLIDRSRESGRASSDTDHRGGIIRNNMITYTENLFSRDRRRDSDAAIIVWDSPNTKVVHNSILTNGNVYKSIEFRWDTNGSEALNNLSDASIGSRNSGAYNESGNFTNASASMFAAPETGNLHLKNSASVPSIANRSTLAQTDVDGEPRDDAKVEPGADRYSNASKSPPSPPKNLGLSGL